MGKAKKVAVKFGTPPPVKRVYPWREIAEALRSKPGEWGVVLENIPASTVWAVNAGKVSPVAPDLGFRTRAVGTYQADGAKKRMCSALWMVYEAELDTSRAKKNGVER